MFKKVFQSRFLHIAIAFVVGLFISEVEFFYTRRGAVDTTSASIPTPLPLNANVFPPLSTTMKYGYNYGKGDDIYNASYVKDNVLHVYIPRPEHEKIVQRYAFSNNNNNNNIYNNINNNGPRIAVIMKVFFWDPWLRENALKYVIDCVHVHVYVR